MRDLFLQYKPFFVFLIKFFALYALLTIGYRLYLSQYDVARFEVDGFTRMVAHQSEGILRFLGKEVKTEQNVSEPCMNLIYKGKFVARIIEGCNALSVMILFAAFVFAFSSKWFKTMLYILVGCLIIHVLNVFRIALLAMALYDLPQYEHLLHGVVFPLFIYSVVFVLWVLWIQKFSGYAQRGAEK
ncbi:MULTISPECIES: exosortase family protein XrtF [Flavobacterium]|uniref:exosortase family protein XrtF n=1 Tax=Flavobacterium TaxID=237 RepID=UPI001FCAE2F9|nr:MULTISPECIES: exosortase family protein XrtF [Flavobacterium]UOK42695.1 exosortase family protein XrtF [Flavobacterium enshiense]